MCPSEGRACPSWPMQAAPMAPALRRGARIPDDLLTLVAIPAQDQASRLMEGLAMSSLPATSRNSRVSGRGASHQPFSLFRHSRQILPWASITASAATAALPSAPPAPPPQTTAPPSTTPSSTPTSFAGTPLPKPLCGGGTPFASSASPRNNGSMWVTMACLTRKGHAPGYKNDNQDSMVVYETFMAPSRSVMAVFDGHGLQGHKVSAFARDQLPLTLQRRLAEGTAADDALAGAFAAVNERMETAPEDRAKGPVPCPGCGGECGGCRPTCGFDAYNSGSTAVVSYIDGDVLTTAWAGDSRAVLGVERPRTGRAAAAAASAQQQQQQQQQTATPGATPSTQGSPPASSSPSFFALRMPSFGSGEESGSGNTPAPATVAATSATTTITATAAIGAPAAQPAKAAPSYAWHSVELTRDHKPERPDERRRIMLYGGRVARTYSSGGVPQGPYRVWLRDYDYPGLAMSRALGDLAARPAGIIGTPDITQVVLPAGPRGGSGAVAAPGEAKAVGGAKPSRCFVVWASDGVWEFMSNADVVDLVGARLAWQQERHQYGAALQASRAGQRGGGGGGAGAEAGAGAGATAAGGAGASPESGPEDKPGLWGHRVALDTFRAGFGATDVTDPGRLTTTTSGSRSDRLSVRPWYWPLLSQLGWGPKPSKASTSAATACRALVDESLARWTKEYGGQYIDDITVVVAQFEPL